MLKIVDVSMYNTITDYALLKQNVSAILIKSSQGVLEDKTFRDKLAGAQAVGLRAGVWHFYHVIFDPDVYPLNWACWNGKVSKHWQEEEHPLDRTAEAKCGASSEPAPVAHGNTPPSAKQPKA